MELIFDLLPLLVIYALARAFTRKKRPAAATTPADPDAPAPLNGFEQLLDALAAAQADAERSAGLAPADPTAGATVAPPPRRTLGDATPLRPSRRPLAPKQHVGNLSFDGPTFDERATFDASAASLDRRPTLEERATLDGGRFYDDAAPFDRAPARTADAHAGVDAAGFETARFSEHGLRGHRPAASPPPTALPLRSAGGVAARLRNPATAREAFVMQMLMERRGRRR